MWENVKLNLGEKKVHSVTDVDFKWLGADLEVSKILTSCGCTNAEYDPESKNLKVRFKAPGIPKHLEYKGEYVTTKHVVVHTKDKDEYKLSFTVKVKSKL